MFSSLFLKCAASVVKLKFATPFSTVRADPSTESPVRPDASTESPVRPDASTASPFALSLSKGERLDAQHNGLSKGERLDAQHNGLSKGERLDAQDNGLSKYEPSTAVPSFDRLRTGFELRRSA